MKIAVFGVGYVGLITGACLARTGKYVYCVDNDFDKIEDIKKGILPIHEPGLEDLLKNNIKNICLTIDAQSAVKHAEVIIIAVGTPFDGLNIDLSYIKQVSQEIGEALKNIQKYKVIVVKSTVTPGTTLDVVRPIILKNSGKTNDDVGFCMNPEFLREGKAIDDFNTPDRIVLGVSSKKVEDVMRQVYSGYGQTDYVITNPTTAEMIKYTANSFLALTISYANEIARICESLQEVDSEDVFGGVMLDKRISPIIEGNRIIPDFMSYLRAGCGFGGSCFPKDVKALSAFESAAKVEGGLLAALLEVNDTQVKHIYKLGIKRCSRKVEAIAILGTAFKPDTDDIRESPGVKLAEMALKKGLRVYIHDYKAMENTKKVFGNRVEYCNNPYKALKAADVVFLATIWDKYSEISDDEFETSLKDGSILVDCRSLYKKRGYKSWRVRVGVGHSPINREEKHCNEMPTL